jgi:elongation factor Ts
VIFEKLEIPITAKMVSQLRAKTDSPMMECKKALIEAKGDFDRAEEILRVKLGNKATKVGSRIAAEGLNCVLCSYLKTSYFSSIISSC